MILATHALVGAAIGKSVDNPFLIILLSLVFHFVLDGFRHGEYLDSRVATFKNTAWKVFLDLSAGGIIVFFAIFFYRNNFETVRNILLGSFFSMFPDLLIVLYWILRWKILQKLYDFHNLVCHFYSPFSPEREWNLVNARNDVIFSALAIMLLFL